MAVVSGRLFTRDAASGVTEVVHVQQSRAGRYHKSPNDATLQLCTLRWELEHFFHSLFVGRLWWLSMYILAKIEMLSHEQFPTKHDSSSGARASAVTVETEK